MQEETMDQIEATKLATALESDRPASKPAKSPTAEEIQAWIVAYLADLMEVEPDEVDATLPFEQYGLDSAEAVELSGDLEDWLGRKLNPTLLYNYPTVEALAGQLAKTNSPII